MKNSDRRWKCSICSKYCVKKQRINKKFCSLECSFIDANKPRLCKSCGNEFVARRRSIRYCDNCKENGEKSKFCYKKDITEKICSNCNKIFLGTRKQILCPNCKMSLPNPLIHHYETVERTILCGKCKINITGFEKIKKSFHFLNSRIGTKICDFCLAEIEDGKKERQQKSPRKRLYKYIHKTDKEKEVSKKKVSDNMKDNNPMFCPNIRTKVSNTIKQKIELGKIVYKRGKDHHLWKGNRPFNLVCRSRLYPTWIYKVMERDKFLCTKCGSNRDLHVHHIRFLRTIIENVLQRNDIKSIKDVDVSSNLYENLIQSVINEHNLCDGITLCKSCHAKIDSRYRAYKTKKTK